MALVSLRYRPGINRDTTQYAGEGYWYDCDKVRWFSGFPETIGGWAKASPEFVGVCRAITAWSSLDGEKNIGIGTNKKYYIQQGQTLYDITPIRATTTNTASFSASNGSTTLTVTDNNHGAAVGDYVTFSGAASLGGLVTAGVLNAEHEIATVTDANTYTIELSVTANASDTGNGGASIVAAYQINIGGATTSSGSGWGAGGYGEDGYGDASDITTVTAALRLWSHDAWGEDLVHCVRDGGIYYHDYSGGLSARSVALSDLGGANDAPTVARQVIVSERDRHTICFACDPASAVGTQDLMLIRWSTQEDITQWEPLQTNTAGDLRLSSGSEIISAIQTKQQTLVFTDTSLYGMQYIGPPFTFGVNKVSDVSKPISFNAAVAVNDSVFWMGDGEFYVYNGRVQEIDCPVSDFVFGGLNLDHKAKICAGHNAEFSEVWWFYPADESTSNSRYVIYNYADNAWSIGTLAREAWLPRGIFDYPIAAGLDGYLYYHEFGTNDGSTNPESAISAYLESYAIDMDEGDRIMFAHRVLPDITFRNSDWETPTATFTIKAREYPGTPTDSPNQSDAENITATSVSTVEAFTRVLYVRIRGRSMAIRVESNELNTSWRLGIPRIDVRPDGRR